MIGGVYRALLIGNSTFPDDPHNLFDLNGPVNDLPFLREALTDPESGLFEPENIHLLPERTKREITTAVEEFFRGATHDDTLLLYYSGHGLVDEYDSLFLCARDTRTSLLVSTGISDAEIDGMMKGSSAGRFVVVLDCCHSGAFKSGGLPARLKGKGRFLLTSSRRGDLSRDAQRPHEPSAFTRHLVNALRAGHDSDNDGYVSVNDVYMQILEPLQQETKQIPQRHFDHGAVGDIALARAGARVRAEPAPVGAAEARPILAVSPPTIELRDVDVDEELPIEIVDVFNEGGGELEWTARSTVDWIDVVQRDTYCELQLRPLRAGVNRGTVHIRDAGRGGSRTVRVLVEVRVPEEHATLEVSPAELDFGSLNVGTSCPPRTLLIKQTSAAAPPRASATASWIAVKQAEDVVTVTVDTANAGELEGHVLVRGEAGDRVVPVRAVIEQGPIVGVQPRTVDFGEVTEGEAPRATITISNKGTGDLMWEYGTSGDFFRARRNRNRLSLTLTGEVGDHVGSLWIRSNGGEATIEVRANVARKARPRAAAPAEKRSATPTPRVRHRKKMKRTSATPPRKATSASDRTGMLIDGRYRISGDLGSGAFTDVYLAEDQMLGRQVALQILHKPYAADEPSSERFRREARIAAGISHPNVAAIYDYGEAEGTYYIVMEYLDGRSLDELLAAHGPAPVHVAIDYARQILAALRFAHRNGIVHRAISPHNVVVDAEGRVKVTNFGIAAAFRMTEAIVGTAQYLSPDQVKGTAADQRSDIYSVGVILYELLTGSVPFTGETPVEIAMKHVTEMPEPPSARRREIPRELDSVVMRALAKTPESRYGSADEMDRALEKATSRVDSA